MSQGKNLDKAIENIKNAIKGYLHLQKKHVCGFDQRKKNRFVGEVIA